MKKILLALLVLLSASGEIMAKEQSRNMNFSDSVHALDTNKKGLRVHFQEHAAVYYLRNNSTHFAEIKKALEKSEKDHKSVNLVIDAISLEIQSLKN
ncbi:MAG: hypothetical protein ACXWQO_05550 [Bdellovibrionota bacterium]